MKNTKVVREYKKVMYRMTQLVHPDISIDEMDEAMNWSLDKRFRNYDINIVNNYVKERNSDGELKDRSIKTNVSNLSNYILGHPDKPIATSWGVLFNQPGVDGEVNLLTDLMKTFMDQRNIHKAEMFKYPKGTEEFQTYNLLQLLDKLDGNAIYGALSNSSCMFYNINVAASITAQGRSLISSVIMFFEMFLSNNVKFGSLDEVITFINNVISERSDRHYDDKEILDRDIDVVECFSKIVYSCGDFRKGDIKWIPDERDMDIIWTMINRLDQEDINRLYYKNNLLAFMDNKSMTKALIYILNNLKEPYLDPNKIPDEIHVELEVLTDLLREYVFYNYQIIDRIDRNIHMIKNIAALSDTDSAIVSLDGWYRYVLEKVKGIKFPITQVKTDEYRYLNDEPCTEYSPTVLDYDFYNDKIIEKKRLINLVTIIPQDGLRYSIINIMSHICGVLVNEYMVQYTKNTHSYSDDKKCLIISKNEFLFKRVLMTDNKKNYATIQEIQEGKMIPKGIDTELDIKGLPINKSTLNENARDRLQKILYEDILTTNKIDQLKILKDLAIFEKQIFQSLESGDKTYYKPLSIKSFNNYDDPMRQQGVKASVIWNEVRDPDLEAIDLTARNTIDIIKVNIDEDNVDKIKDSYPETYEKLLGVLRNQEIQRFITIEERKQKKSGKIEGEGEITALAIPVDVKTPRWVMEFIDYTSIINDCLCNFPIESVGIDKMKKQSINYTNIISI